TAVLGIDAGFGIQSFAQGRIELCTGQCQAVDRFGIHPRKQREQDAGTGPRGLARALAGNLVALDQCHAAAALGKFERGKTTDDAAAGNQYAHAHLPAGNGGSRRARNRASTSAMLVSRIRMAGSVSCIWEAVGKNYAGLDESRSHLLVNPLFAGRSLLYLAPWSSPRYKNPAPAKTAPDHHWN